MAKDMKKSYGNKSESDKGSPKGSKRPSEIELPPMQKRSVKSSKKK